MSYLKHLPKTFKANVLTMQLYCGNTNTLNISTVLFMLFKPNINNCQEIKVKKNANKTITKIMQPPAQTFTTVLKRNTNRFVPKGSQIYEDYTTTYFPKNVKS